MDTVTKVLVETIDDTGYRVDIAADGYGTYTVTAVGYHDGERFIVRGPDLYETVIELAAQIGMDLEDG